MRNISVCVVQQNRLQIITCSFVYCLYEKSIERYSNSERIDVLLLSAQSQDDVIILRLLWDNKHPRNASKGTGKTKSSTEHETFVSRIPFVQRTNERKLRLSADEWVKERASQEFVPCLFGLKKKIWNLKNESSAKCSVRCQLCWSHEEPYQHWASWFSNTFTEWKHFVSQFVCLLI